MTFNDIANSTLMYICVIIGIAYVLGFAILYFVRSWRRGLAIGLSKDMLMDVVKSSATFTIVPSLAIVIGLFSLVAMLGVPWPWFRLSVIGSFAYEIMASDAVLKSTGVDLATAGADTFVLIMYVMSICILGGIITAILIAKKLQFGTLKVKEKDKRWGSLSNSLFMLSIMSVLLVPMILAGGVSLLTWLTSLVVTIVLGILSEKLSIHWLNNFILAFSLLVAMASSVIWTNLIG